jgi:hypothetical protein
LADIAIIFIIYQPKQIHNQSICNFSISWDKIRWSEKAFKEFKRRVRFFDWQGLGEKNPGYPIR